MKVYLLRHATRNFTTGDVPLNEEGKAEAIELAEQPHWADLTCVLSSPKKRAQMTVEPLVETYQLKLKVEPALDQMHSGEDEAKFKARVQNLIYRVEQGEFGEQVLVCSHSDWLSMATQVIPSDSPDLSYQMFHCAEFMSFDLEQGLWKVL